MESSTVEMYMRKYMKDILIDISKDYSINIKDLKKQYLKSNKQKNITKKPSIYSHNHEIDNKSHPDCKLCNSHGNMLDPSINEMYFVIMNKEVCK